LINRIVLYIDDLDRCPPDRVVQVLQAIHLLLAFPLFVVVVAVDSRWLSQSLYKQYEGMLSAGPCENGQEGVSQPATPQNYLEKIFQIPFWVRPLTPHARVRIIQGLLNKPGAPDSGGGQADLNVNIARPAKGETWPVKEPVRPYSKEIKIEMNPSGMETGDQEMKFMEELADLLGETPRSVKRFVNLYWLVKTIALAYSPAFNDDSQSYPEYQQVLFLLTVLTGLPVISTRFFHLLRELPADAKGPAVEMNQAAQIHSSNTLKDLLARLQQEYRPTSPNGEMAQVEIDRLQKWLAGYKQGAWLNMPLSVLNTWAAQATRFSFQME
jgi:hypothetical protein